MRRSLIVAAALLLVACEKHTPTPTSGSASASPAAAAPTAAIPETEIPSSEDFEDEAERDITPDTLESEVVAIEKEIGD